jgi:hypothetical protein
MVRECFCPYLDGPEKCGMAGWFLSAESVQEKIGKFLEVHVA